MSEPTPLQESLTRWRLHAVQPDPPPAAGSPFPDDLDLIAAEHAHDLATRRWHAAIPQEFHRATLTHFADRGWLPEAEAWSHNPAGRNVVILGAVGVGKSHLAMGMVRPACHSGLDVHVVTAPRLMDRLRPNGPAEYMEELCWFDRLVIDDVGTARPSEWTEERFDLLVDSRRREQLPTIFTTNLLPEALAEHVGPRCYSRMVGQALVIELSGEDRRRT